MGSSLMRQDKKFSYINISNHLELQKILKVDYYKLGILLDLDCPGSENVFNQVEYSSAHILKLFFFNKIKHACSFGNNTCVTMSHTFG